MIPKLYQNCLVACSSAKLHSVMHQVTTKPTPSENKTTQALLEFEPELSNTLIFYIPSEKAI